MGALLTACSPWHDMKQPPPGSPEVAVPFLPTLSPPCSPLPSLTAAVGYQSVLRAAVPISACAHGPTTRHESPGQAPAALVALLLSLGAVE